MRQAPHQLRVDPVQGHIDRRSLGVQLHCHIGEGITMFAIEIPGVGAFLPFGEGTQLDYICRIEQRRQSVEHRFSIGLRVMGGRDHLASPRRQHRMIHSATVTGSRPHNARVTIIALMRAARPLELQVRFEVFWVAWCQPARPFVFMVIVLAPQRTALRLASIRWLSQSLTSASIQPTARPPRDTGLGKLPWEIRR